MAAGLTIAGLLTALAGVLLLFRYGMPFHVEGKGAVYIVTGEIDVDEVKMEARYRRLGYVGLALAILGTALQVLGALYG